MLQQRYIAHGTAQANVDRKRIFANEMHKIVGEVNRDSLIFDVANRSKAV